MEQINVEMSVTQLREQGLAYLNAARFKQNLNRERALFEKSQEAHNNKLLKGLSDAEKAKVLDAEIARLTGLLKEVSQ